MRERVKERGRRGWKEGGGMDGGRVGWKEGGEVGRREERREGGSRREEGR